MSMRIEARIQDSFAAQGLMRTLGAELLHAAAGEVRIGLRNGPHISQQQGFAHAGAVAAVLDSACGYAALTRCAADSEVVTVEFKINLLKPALGERFLAVARVVQAGRRLSVCSGELHAYASAGEAHKVVALMQATLAAVPR